MLLPRRETREDVKRPGEECTCVPSRRLPRTGAQWTCVQSSRLYAQPSPRSTRRESDVVVTEVWSAWISARLRWVRMSVEITRGISEIISRLPLCVARDKEQSRLASNEVALSKERIFARFMTRRGTRNNAALLERIQVEMK